MQADWTLVPWPGAFARSVMLKKVEKALQMPEQEATLQHLKPLIL
jgi:hypothetical protein